MQSFELYASTRVVFGADGIDQLGDLAKGLSSRRVLVVTDSGIVSAGHAQRGMESLKNHGCEPHLWPHVVENPSTDTVAQALEFGRHVQPDLIVGFGGGSSMDTAKGLNFLLSNGGEMHDYWGVGKATKPMLPMIAVPTTAGTGSETQSFALISDAKTHVKMACGDKKAAFRVAILDPKLTLSQPRQVTALTGIDAISHAIEAYVTTRRNDASRMFALEAWRHLSTSFAAVMQDGEDLSARGAMQWGACLAGLAIEHSMLGAAHALANPLTAEYGLVHGRAIGVMLPHVIRFNALVCEDDYRTLVSAAGESSGQDAGETLAGMVDEFRALAGIPESLPEFGIDAARLPELARAAAKQWTGGFNPRTVNEESLLGLYKSALHPN